MTKLKWQNLLAFWKWLTGKYISDYQDYENGLGGISAQISFLVH